MKKGILKNVGKYSLLIGGFVLYLSGLGVSVYSNGQVSESKRDKNKFISDYKLSQEYRDIVDEKVEVYYDALQTGALSEKEYNQKINELTTDEFARECLVKSGDIELINNLKSCENQIFDNQKLSASQLVVMGTGAVGLMIGVAISDEKSL